MFTRCPPLTWTAAKLLPDRSPLKHVLLHAIARMPRTMHTLMRSDGGLSQLTSRPTAAVASHQWLDTLNRRFQADPPSSGSHTPSGGLNSAGVLVPKIRQISWGLGKLALRWPVSAPPLLRLSRAPASLGHSAAWAWLASHIGPPRACLRHRSTNSTTRHSGTGCRGSRAGRLTDAPGPPTASPPLCSTPPRRTSSVTPCRASFWTPPRCAAATP